MLRTIQAFAAAGLCLVFSSAIHAEEKSETRKDKSVPTAESAAPLSVAPLDHVQYPDDRPEWVSQSADHAESDTIVIHSGICGTKDEAEEMLVLMTSAAVQDAVERLIDESSHAPVDREVNVDPDWVEEHLIDERYIGPVHRGGEIAYEGAFKLRLDAEAKEGLQSQILNHQTGERLAVMGIVALFGFGSFVGGSIVLGGWNARLHRPQSGQMIQ